MTTRHDCSKEVWHKTGFYHCRRPATVEHEGKHYCWQHDPSRVEADKERRRATWKAKWDVKMDRKAAKNKRIACNAKLAALVTPELVALLERLADYARQAAKAAKGSPDDVDCAYNDEEITRALAARIREALEANDDPR